MKTKVNYKESCCSRFVLSVVLGLLVAGCSGSPTAPSDPPANQPPPAPTLYTIQGLVREAGSARGLSATVRVVDGPNAGQSANTDGNGAYSLPGLTFAGFNIEASATGYNSAGRPALLNAGSPTHIENFLLLPTALWSRAGSNNTVFDMPTYVARVRITGRYAQNSSNFIVRVGGRLLVNELLGTFWELVRYDGVHLTTGGVVEITNSTGVAWSFTEVR